MKIETTVEISKPPSEVYEFLTDEENLSIWIKNFIRLDRLEGEDGQVGSTSRHIYNENGKTIEMIEEILAVRENELFEAILRNDEMEMRIRNELSERDDRGTILKVQSELKPKKFWTRLTTMLFRKRISRRQHSDLHRLKEAVEALREEFE